MRILCYGDSNTWGAVPSTINDRFDENIRFPKVLNKLLGEGWDVAEEGLRARTVACDDIKEPKGNRNGAKFFAQCVFSHDPIDYIILMLGTNDLKFKFNKTCKDLAQNLKIHYIDFLREKMANYLIVCPKIIIVAPCIIDETKFEGFDGATEKSKEFNLYYKRLAELENCYFVSNECLEHGSDGVHLTSQSHKKLAKEIYKLIEEIDRED